MRRKLFARPAIIFALVALLLTQSPAPATAVVVAPVAAAPVQSSNVGVDGFYSVNKAQRGRTIQAAIVLDIPNGYHVNANRPLGKYAVPTTVKIEAPRGVRVSPVIFPRATVRRPKFSQGEQLALYEGRAVIRFNVTIPADYEQGVTELRARVYFQSCTDEVCFPPATRNLTLPIGVVGANDSVQRINGQIFGGGRGRRG